MAALVLLQREDGVWLPSEDSGSLKEDGAFWRIYQASFPIEEREPEEVILATAEDPLGLALTFRRPWLPGRKPETVGFCTLQVLPSIAAAFIVYLALDAGVRGQGLGSSLLAAVTDAGVFAAAGLPRPVCRVLEVEHPDLAETEENRIVREKRLRFFEKSGLTPLYDGYLQPALSPDTHILPMRLLTDGKTSLSSEAVVAALYREKYQRVNGLNPGMLEALYRQSFGKELP